MTNDYLNNTLLFTDGACSGNPGRGGFGAVIYYPDGEVVELGGGAESTTNNRMELTAVIRGLRSMSEVKGKLWILTDSTYVIRGITQWIWGWKKRNLTNSAGAEVANKDLWLDLNKQVQIHSKTAKLEWKYLRGHSGTPGNERCDEIAVAFTKKEFVQLYKGPLLQYSIPIHDLPADMSLPPMKDHKEKKVRAHSYLSYVNGQLRRHSSWSECEAIVKGRSGAKFKKSKSSEDEASIVKSWGLNPNKLDEI